MGYSKQRSKVGLGICIVDSGVRLGWEINSRQQSKVGLGYSKQRSKVGLGIVSSGVRLGWDIHSG